MGLSNWLRGEWGSGKIDRDTTYWRKREIVTVQGMTHQPKRGWRAVPNTDMNLQRGSSGWFRLQTKDTTGVIAKQEGSRWQPTVIERAQSTEDARSPWFWFQRTHGAPGHAARHAIHESANDPRTMDAVWGTVRWGGQPPDPRGSYPTGEPTVESWPGGADPRGEPPSGYTSW